MKILVDADACPVKSIIEQEASKRSIPLYYIHDSNHVLTSNYATIIPISPGRDAVDLHLANMLEAGDLAITQDYGLASLVLGKRANCLHPSGMRYTLDNIDMLLMERHMAAKFRRGGGRTKGPKPRDKGQDDAFRKVLVSILDN